MENNSNDLSGWLTEAETLARLEVGRSTLVRLREARKLEARHRRAPGRTRREVVFNPVEVDELAASKQARTPVLADNDREQSLNGDGRSFNGDAQAIARRPPAASEVWGSLFQFLERGVRAQAAEPRAFLTLAEASDYMGLSKTFLRRLMADGFPFYRDGSIKFRKVDLDRYCFGALTPLDPPPLEPPTPTKLIHLRYPKDEANA